MKTCSKALRGVVAAVALLAAGSAARATDVPPPTVDQLKRGYLVCDRDATLRRMSAPEAANCSVIAEQVLQRAFDGDLDRLLAWWRVERLVPEQLAGPP